MTELQTAEPPSEKARVRAEIAAALAGPGFGGALPAPAAPTLAEAVALEQRLGRARVALEEERTVRGIMRRLGPALRRITTKGATDGPD